MMTKKKISAKDLTLLSSYIDGNLSPKEQVRLVSRLKQDQTLSAALIELKQTRFLLKKTKTLRAPRNFTLTPEQVAQIQPARRSFALPVLSFSSVLAALLLVFAILFETLPSSNLAKFGSNQPQMEYTMDMAEAPMMETQTMQALPEEESLMEPLERSSLNLLDLQGNPPIINWGGPGFSSGGYGMGGGSDNIEGLGGAPEFLTEPALDDPEFIPPPPDAVPSEPIIEPTPDERESSDAPQSTLTEKSMAEPITGTGPILGIPSAEETEYYNQAVLDILEEEDRVYQKMQNQIPPIRFLQIGLGLLTLSTALAALWIYRKSSL